MRRVHRDLSRDEVEQLRRSIEARIPRSDEPIGPLIRDMRLVIKMSQAEYAKTCGVATRVLAELEAGKGNPSLETVNKLLWPYSYRLGIVRNDER